MFDGKYNYEGDFLLNKIYLHCMEIKHYFIILLLNYYFILDREERRVWEEIEYMIIE